MPSETSESGAAGESRIAREIAISLPLFSLSALEWSVAETQNAAAPRARDGNQALPVLALHGWLDNAASFRRLIPLLPADRRIVALDLPG
ncbi:MAG: hypothetical protein RIF32_13950, partial [Leptospirales bacterium]